MDEKLDLILKSLVDLKEEVSGLKGGFIGLEGEFSGLKGGFIGLEGEFSGLKGEFISLKGEFSGLKGEVTDLKKEMTDLKVEFTSFKQETAKNFYVVHESITRLENTQRDDVLALLKHIDSKMIDSKAETTVLNHRLFQVESQTERLIKQQ
ncbi:MAG: hypothetical protein LRY71_06625 [Bacillaceae bacterium]|nr:hypothetical protein [Bacillaceae bacterium]